jgi:beta-lactam-binding protein with PASTA domain
VPSFTVTTASEKVTLDDSGAARAPFTVTNTSPQPLRGRLVARPRDPAKPEWLTVAGESVRDFAPNGAQQVVVELKVPPGTTPGSYSFRLDAVSEDDPDEDFTEGPSVAFDVTAPPPPPPKKKFPWWILAIVGAVVLLIIIGVVIWLLVRDGGSESATVPAVVGQTSGAAQSALTSAGYTFSVSEAGVAEPQQDGIVQSQDPAAGTPQPRGTAVAIVVGRNVVVPNVVNLAQDQALALLRGARLEPSVVRVHVPVPFQIGIVGRQTPQGGTRLPLRGQVTIFVNVFP